MKSLVLNVFNILALMTSASNAYASSYSTCRWTSVHECREKAVGSSCGSNRGCYAASRSFSEPVCECVEAYSKQLNECRSTSDRRCQGILAGSRVENGICEIVAIRLQEPECRFEVVLAYHLDTKYYDTSFGGRCDLNVGGPCYHGVGGACYAGFGGPRYDGFGGPCYAGRGGPCSERSKCPEICTSCIPHCCK